MFHANPVSAAQGWAWITQGASLVGRDPRLWLAMSAVYLAIALALGLIPFVGWLVLVLLSPALLIGGLLVARSLHDSAGATSGNPDTAPAGNIWVRLRKFMATATRRLFAGFRREDKMLPVMVISTLLLGGVVVIRILAQLLRVGGAALPTMFSGATPALWLPALVGLVVVLSLYALMLMAFVYTVPLILFRGAHPLPAIESAFSAAAQNWKAFALYAGLFSLAGEVARVLFLYLSFPYDYLAFLGLGLVLLPVLTASLYVSYLDLFTRRLASTG